MNSKGFTLLEVLVVISITVTISGFLILNFSRSRVDLNQNVIILIDAIREAQSLALSGSLTQGQHRCGYGIKFSGSSYSIYAGPDASAVDCTTDNHIYDGTDTIVRSVAIPDTLRIVQPSPDIFFEPPSPTTYIDGAKGAGISATLSIHRRQQLCPGPDCRSITITGAGRIQIQ